MSFELKVGPLALGVSFALACYALWTTNRRTTHKQPPGPKGLPFLGPLFELSSTPWKQFETWKARYGMSKTPYVRLLSQLGLANRLFGVPQRGRPKDAYPQHAQGCG